MKVHQTYVTVLLADYLFTDMDVDHQSGVGHTTKDPLNWGKLGSRTEDTPFTKTSFMNVPDDWLRDL